ncbi:MAG: histidinol-phosphate transaminase [Opitutales bacterium]
MADAADSSGFDPDRLAEPAIVAARAYVPGTQPAGGGWVKLNTNENPYPASPRVEQAVTAEASRLRLYPNPTSQPLREALARHHRVLPEQVIVGNGSDDILRLLVQAFAGVPGRSGAAPIPSYSLYPVLLEGQGASFRSIDFDRDLTLDVDALLALGADILFLTHPNAPTGVAFPHRSIRTLLEGFPGIVVVDQAYVDFGGESVPVEPLLMKHPNLFIVRTFSKSFALAGLRVGYGIGHPGVIALLDKIRDAYNLDRLAQAGALAALEDAAYTGAILGKIGRIRDYYAAEFRQRGWFVYPSEANFLFVEPRNGEGAAGADVARDLFTFLETGKILVRYFGNHPQTEAFLRITIGTEDDMQALSERVDAWVAAGSRSG